MSSSYLYVDSPVDINKVIGNYGCVRFVSLLSSIECTNDYYCLEMNNFAMGKLDSTPYRVLLPKKHADSARSAKMVVELICHWYNLNIPELQNGMNFIRNGIHTLSLCFLECKVIYVATLSTSDSVQDHWFEGPYLGYLESVKPLSSAQIQELAFKESSDVGKTIRNILENLRIMCRNESASFNTSLIKLSMPSSRQQFADPRQNLPSTQQSNISFQSEDNYLRSSPSNSSQSPNSFRNTSSGGHNTITALAPTNPMFPGNRLITDESQLDFNSFNTQAYQVCGADLEQREEPKRKDSTRVISSRTDETISSLDSDSSSSKRMKRSRTKIDPAILVAEESDIFELKGQFIAVHPLEDLMYFLPNDVEMSSHLYPGINCIEIASKAMPLKKELTIEIERTERPLFGNKFTWQWSLKSPEPEPESRRNGDLVWFKDLNPPERNDLYVNMIALLVSSDTKQKGDFASVIFTDFTKNPRLKQYPLFDKFIGNFDKKLDEDEGMRTVMFPERYREFDRKIQNAYHKTLHQTYAPDSINHTASRIVCLLTFKTKRFNGLLNAVAYRYEPIHPGLILNLRERRHLFQLYQRAIDARKVHLLGERIRPFNVPSINADIADYTIEYCPSLRQLERTNEDFLEINSAAQISSSLQLDQKCFSIDAKILAFFTQDDLINRWTILVQIQDIGTEEDVSSSETRFIDPRSILSIEILGEENLQYFTAKYGSTRADAIQHLAKYCGRRCKLRLKRGYITLRSQIALLVWCPIELTLEELEVKLETN